jgi:hypothetical protein
MRNKLAPQAGEDLIKLTPRLIKLIIKTIKYSKGGLDKDERRELGEDLLMLAYEILGDLVD